MRRMLRMDFLSHHLHVEQEKINTVYSQYSSSNEDFGPYGLGIWNECLDGGYSSTDPFPDSCRKAHRISHPGCFGYWNYVSRRDNYYLNFLPTYTCDQSNAWCGRGSKPTDPEACPEIQYSS